MVHNDMFLIRQKTKFHIDFFIFDAITILIEYNCLSFFNKILLKYAE